MKIEDIIHEYTRKQFERYKSESLNCFDNIQHSRDLILPDIDKTEILNLIHNKDKLLKLQQDLSNVNLQEFEGNASGLRSYYETDIENFNREVEELKSEYNNKIDFIKQRREDSIADAEQAKSEYISLKENQLEEINKIYKELLTYKNELEKLSRLYGVTLEVTNIDVTQISKEELLDRMKVARVTIDEILMRPSLMSKLLNYIHVDNDVMQCCVAMVLLFIGYILRPYSLALISVIFISFFIKDSLDMNKKKELLVFTYQMMGDIDFNPLIYDKSYNELNKEVDFQKAVSIENDIRLLEDELKSRIDDMQSINPEILLNKTNMAYLNYLQSEEYINDLKEIHDSFDLEKEHLSNTLKEDIELLDKYIADIKKRNIVLGEYFNQSMTLSQGMLNMATYDGDSPIAYAGFMMPRENVMFVCRNYDQREEVVNYLQLLLCNYLCNVKPKTLRTTIYDQYGLGAEVTQFDVPDLDNFINIKTEKLDNILEELKNIKRERSTAFKGKTIEEYNSFASEKGMLTYNYRLLIVLSSDDISTNKEFLALMRDSTQYGIYIWCVMDSSEKEKPEEFLAVTKDFITCEGYGKLKTIQGVVLDKLKEGYKYAKYSVELGIRTVGNFALECDKTEIPKFLYEEDYLPYAIPDDKVWTYDTLDGIELHFGFEGGDPMKPAGIVLGDEPPHCVMGGSTGSGKSVCINNVLATCLRMYSPRWLEMVMVDLKRAEFGMYQGAAQIPHASVCAGTTDAEYMLSVFEYVLNDMERRNKLFEKNGVKNIKGYNKKMLKENRMDDIMPRILFLVDEFQEMFRAIEGAIQDKIKGNIARLASKARSCGVHMWFTSQSMAGTVSQDVLNQYAMRAALACPPDVSKSIIGSEKAAELLGTKGWVYTNPTAGVDQKKTKIWKVPFIPDDYIPKYITELRERCDREGLPNRNPIFYDEEQLYDKDKLDSLINNPKLKALDNLFILGERVDYKPGNSPVTIRINHDDKQNIAYTAYNRKSMLNGINTFIENIKSKDNVELIIHSADKASTSLLSLRDRVEEKYKFFLDPKLETDDILTILEDSIEERKSKPLDELTTAYFIGIGWDKLDKIASSPNFKMQDRLKIILKEGPSYKLHFIVCAKEWKELKKYIGELEFRIGSFTEEKESFNIIGNSKLYKIKDYQMLGMYGSDTYKCKLYQFPIEGKIEENIVDLKDII